MQTPETVSLEPADWDCIVSEMKKLAMTCDVDSRRRFSVATRMAFANHAKVYRRIASEIDAQRSSALASRKAPS